MSCLSATKILLYLIIATSVVYLVAFAYGVGLHVGQVHVMTQAVKAHVGAFDLRTGKFYFSKELP